MSWLPKRSVLVPVDFSTASAEALRTALECASGPNQVHAVHVLVPLDAVSPGVIWGHITNATREAALREHFQKFLAAEGLPALDLLVRIGEPATEVAAAARAVQADLIVIPSHGYHGVQRLLFGSVAEGVLRHVSCPLLVLHRDEDPAAP